MTKESLDAAIAEMRRHRIAIEQHELHIQKLAAAVEKTKLHLRGEVLVEYLNLDRLIESFAQEYGVSKEEILNAIESEKRM
ncbi:MAG: hypothetical protein M0Q91_13820 [Methanoregula sp.]|nr:hypothetical protein [Methanoregula sp.]